MGFNRSIFLSGFRPLFSVLFLCAAGGIRADGITSLEAGTKTLGCIDCMQWRAIGECNWLKCKLIKCSVKVSPKVGHYIPDLLVASYSPSKMPISDLRKVKITKAPTATMSEELIPGNTSLDYKNVNVYGNPAITGYKALNSNGGWMCESVVKIPWQPYFESASDLQWSDVFSIEAKLMWASLGLLSHPIKANLPLGKWGSVYPRCGWGIHPYDAINAAVAAHRAADIVTDDKISAHIKVPLGTDCGEKCWPPGKVVEGDKKTHKFQSLYPVYEDKNYVFGGSPSKFANGRNKNSKEGYVFALWRPYKCCEKKGQFFLGSIDWESYP
jgi:integrating conjugative element protein (TIGR03756 family)